MKMLSVILFFFAAILPLSAEELQYGLIHLNATANKEVSNDELITQLQVIEQGKQSGQLTNLVNTKTGLVLDAVKNFPAISAKTSHYTTRPIYKDGKIEQWQVTQTISLKTANFDQMSQFIADINSLAQIQSMQFQVSQSQADKVKTELIKQAISTFKDKAKLVAEQFNEPDYQLVSLSIDSHQSSPFQERSVLMAAKSQSDAVPAALAAGTNTVSITVNGTIQLSTPAQ